MAFEFKKHLIKVQGRQYLPVSARIVWFREAHPDWGVETEPLEINHEKQYAVFRARIYNAEGKLMAMGTKKEDVKGFGDYIEKSETGAIGRALALCGFGTQFSPDLDEGSGRPADSPQPMGGRYGGGNSGNSSYGNSNRYGGSDRYGNSGGDGGTRSAPPREMSAPPVRDQSHASPPDDGASMRAAMDARRTAPIPPPPAAPAEAAEDDFEALIGADALLDAAEDDPFGDAGAQPAAKPSPARTEARADGPPACVGCGKALTKAQQDLSVRNYGEALCPTCQREKPRTGRAAVAER